ncbi:Bardet-Biedl syndrome 10 protein homolog [Pecten maximus]|uniref:Bardet-Biedl syndrome 10 protein homolog n=1 Tax=Pecten maximus TaxID=6579 RepID=UPI001458DBB9|nr:Bardet-Biedl syndrome 10 protein homolog [Pecten maximus]
MNSTGNLTVVDFSTVKLICNTLENVVKRSFGPFGLQTLMSSDTGHLVVTNDGLTMVEALHLSHPIARLVIQSLSKTVHFTGDGSKTFILWLARSVSGIEEEILLNNTQRTPNNGNSCSVENKCRIQMSRNLQKILPELLKGIVEYVWNHSAVCPCNTSLDPAISHRRVIHSVLRPHFPQNISSFFTELLCKMVQFDNDRDFITCLQCLSDDFEMLCIKVVNQPYTSSSLLQSFVIQRDFTVYCPQSLKGNVKFVILRCSIGQLTTEKKNNEKIKLTNSQLIDQYLHKQKKLIEDFISVCQHNKVTLILSTEKIPDFVQAIFQASAISLIHYVSEEEAEFLQTSLKIHPITNLFDTVEENNIGFSKQCNALVIAGRRCVHLNLTELPNMLLVCGLSDGLCKQVMLAFSKALKALLHYHKREDLISIFTQGDSTGQTPESLVKINPICTDDITERVFEHSSDYRETLLTPGATTESSRLCVCSNSVPGNCFEFMAAKYCQDRAREIRVSDLELSTLYKIISKSLLSVPQALHENCCGSQRDRVNFIAKQQSVFSILNGAGKCEDILQLIGYSAGECLEPLSSKLHLLSTVIELLIQLLRIDSVVGVKHIHI